jgi:hypothetical protein
MNELDEILLEQLHSARRRIRLIKRLKKLLKNDKGLIEGEKLVEKKIRFFESMIEDKSLLKKKVKKKKQKESDLLARNPVYEWYRNVFLFTTVGYKIVWDSLTGYMSFFKKDKE